MHGSKSDRLLEAELIGAALRYTAVADWFEARPNNRREKARDLQAMNAFNDIEHELRVSGRRLLRRLGHREVVLQQAVKGLDVS